VVSVALIAKQRGLPLLGTLWAGRGFVRWGFSPFSFFPGLPPGRRGEAKPPSPVGG